MTQFSIDAFGALVSWLTCQTDHIFDRHDIKALNDHINDCIDPPENSSPAPPSPGEVRQLLHYMATGHMADAVRIYRSLTGDGLINSKAAIEAVYAYKSSPFPP